MDFKNMMEGRGNACTLCSEAGPYERSNEVLGSIKSDKTFNLYQAISLSRTLFYGVLSE
jgi:hypothetical protein